MAMPSMPSFAARLPSVALPSFAPQADSIAAQAPTQLPPSTVAPQTDSLKGAIEERLQVRAAAMSEAKAKAAAATSDVQDFVQDSRAGLGEVLTSAADEQPLTRPLELIIAGVLARSLIVEASLTRTASRREREIEEITAASATRVQEVEVSAAAVKHAHRLCPPSAPLHTA